MKIDYSKYRAVSRNIEVSPWAHGVMLLTIRGDAPHRCSKSDTFLDIGIVTPNRSYRVLYRPHPNGNVVLDDTRSVKLWHKDWRSIGRSVGCCFLPEHWPHGMRLERITEVRPW